MTDLTTKMAEIVRFMMILIMIDYDNNNSNLKLKITIVIRLPTKVITIKQ